MSKSNTTLTPYPGACRHALILTAWRDSRAQNVYAAFTADAIQKSLKNAELPTALREQLDWTGSIANAEAIPAEARSEIIS